MLDYSGPNEPWNDGATTAQVIARGIQIYDDIQAALPGTKVWGPVSAWYDRGALTAYMDSLGAGRLAGVDYHNYAMGMSYLTTADAMQQTKSYTQEINQLRLDAQARGVLAEINVDELNFSWRVNDGTPVSEGGFVSPASGELINGRFFTSINTVWMASAIGNILSSGGRAMPYATQNQALGIMVQNDYTGNTAHHPLAGGVQRPNSSPMPAYWGIAMWTGGGMPDLSTAPSAQVRNFPHFGDAFYRVTMSQDPLIDIFAVSNEAGGANVVLINRSMTSSISYRLSLVGASYTRGQAWQTSSGAYPAMYVSPTVVRDASLTSNQLDISLPACTVTTIVLS